MAWLLQAFVVLVTSCKILTALQFDTPAMTWGVLDVDENGPGARYQHVMLSWPAWDRSDFDSDIVAIHGGFSLRNAPLVIENYPGIPVYEYYFEHFEQDPVVWKWNISTLQYEPDSAFAEILPRSGHVGAAMNNVLGAERLLVLHGGLYLNPQDFTVSALGTLILYNFDLGAAVSTTLTGTQPRARVGHMATVLNNRYFMISGGYTVELCQQQSICQLANSDRIETLSDLWIIDLSTPSLQWQQLQPSVPVPPRFFGSLVYLGGKMWIGGGALFNGTIAESGNVTTQLLISGFDYWSGQLALDALTINFTKVAMPSEINKGRGVPHYGSCTIVTHNDTFAIYGGQISQITYRDDIATFNTTDQTWQIRKVPEQGSSIRRGLIAATLVKDLLIFHGGSNPLVAFSDITYHFISTDMWLKPTAVVEPATRYNSAIAYLHTNRGVLFGGFDWQRAYSDVWSLTYYNGIWTWFLVSQDLGIGPRFGHNMFYTGDDDIYIMFGSSMDTVFNDVWKINVIAAPIFCSFVPTNLSPEPRYAAAAVFIKDQGTKGTIYVYGGANVVFRQLAVIDISSVILYSTMYAFDVASEQWRNLSTVVRCLPGARMYTGAAVTTLEGEQVMLMFGGILGPLGSSHRPIATKIATISDDMYMFRPSRNTWTLLHQTSSHFPSPRHGGLLLASTESANRDTVAIVHGGSHSLDYSLSGYSLGDAWSFQLNSTSVSATPLPLTHSPNVSKHIGAFLGGIVLIFGGESFTTYARSTKPFAVQLACLPGTFQAYDHYIINGCELCHKGLYSETFGAAQCTPCPKGTTTAAFGSKSKNSCNRCSLSNCHGRGPCVVSNTTFQLSCDCREPWGGPDCSKNRATLGIVVGTTVTALIFVLVLIYGLARHRYTRLKQDAELNEQLLADTQAELDRAFTIAPEELTLHRRIDLDSPGMFGEVWLASFGDAKVAVKQLKASILELDDLANDEFVAETKLMRSLRHSNIVYFYGCGVRNGNSFLVLEYMARGSLDKLLEKHEHDLPWHQRLELARGAAAGMQYLHGLKPPRIHRDLKSPNLLISDSFVCKVADFGTAKLCQLSNGMAATQSFFQSLDSDNPATFKMTKGVGTLLWLSPEIHDGKPYSLSSDVYSYAIVLWEIASRLQPWKEKKTSWQISECVVEGERPPLTAADTAPRAYLKLMQACWNQDPGARPSFSACVVELTELLKSLDSDV